MAAPLTLLQDVCFVALAQSLLGSAGVRHLADMDTEVGEAAPPGRCPYQRRWSGGYATVSGCGSDIPHRDLLGQDVLLQSMTWPEIVTGPAGRPRAAGGAAVVDQHVAALLAMGILAALRYRQRTEKRERLEVTMARAALDRQLEPAIYHMTGDPIRRPSEPLASGFHERPCGLDKVSDGDIALSRPHYAPPEAGAVKLQKHPVRYRPCGAAMRRTPPRPGRHTDEILREAGYTR